MVGIVSGNNLGLLDSSLAQLGERGLIGQAASGKTGEGAFVNIASGNLVLQGRDDYLASVGLDLAMTRTYNAQGKLNDDNRDNWKSGLVRQVTNLTGTLNAAGSTLTRVDGDGSETTYTCGTDKIYRSMQGAGATDMLRFTTSGTQSQWIWTDGDTGASEVYDWVMGGRLISESDRSGAKNSYLYNAAGLLSQVISASGDSTYFDYTGNNLAQIRTVVSSSVSGAKTTQTRVRYEYDASNRLSAVIVDLTPEDNAIADANTYWTRYTYDGTSNRVATVAQKDGTRLAFTYELNGSNWRVNSMTDALGATVRMAYDLTARATSVTDALGNQTVYSYDAKGQLVSIQGPAINGVAQKIAYEYDANGNVIRMRDGAGNATEMTYDSVGHLTQKKDAEGNAFIRRYHAASNNLLSEGKYLYPYSVSGTGAVQAADPIGVRYVYNNANQIRYRVSSEGRVTEYAYAGELLTAMIEYTGSLHPTAVRQGASLSAFLETDVSRWISDPGFDKSQAKRTDYSYDVRGLLKSSIAYDNIGKDGLGIADGTESRVDYVYDQAGRLLKTIDAAGATSYVYDGLGRLLSTTSAAAKATLYQYDDANNRSIVTLANGLATTSVFDRAGHLISEIQSDSRMALGETRYAYDGNGRLRMTTDPTGKRTHTLYDAAGRKQADVDARGILTEYLYDATDRITKTVTYKLPVNLPSLTDAAGNPADVSLASIRPTKHAEDRAAWNSYDKAGRLVKTVDALGYVKQFYYDGLSRLVKTIYYDMPIAVAALNDAPKPSDIPAAGSARIEQFLYDRDDHLLGKIDASGLITTYQYDAAGQLLEKASYAKLAQPGYILTSTEAVALRKNIGAQDILESNVYNRKGQLIATVDGEQYLTEFIYTRSGNLKEKIRYATPAKITDKVKPEAQRWSYEYTSLNQLAKETGPDGTIIAYQYDDVGNLVSTTRALGTDEARTTRRKFDLQGRLTAELSAQGAELLPAAATAAAIDAIWQKYSVRYAYDAAGRRISSTDQYQNRTLFFHDDAGNVAYTINALGEVEATFYNEFNQLRERVRFARRIGESYLASLTGGTLTGNVLAIFNALKDDRVDVRTSFYYDRKGQLIDQVDAEKFHVRMSYDAFGQVTERTNQIDAAGRLETYNYRYDGSGRLLDTAEDRLFRKTFESKRYDAFGRLVASIDANGNTQTFAYDRRGRQISSKTGPSSTTKTSYDAFDRILTQTDARGNVTTTTYDTQRRLTTVTTAEGIKTVIGMNRHGQRVSIVDGNGVVSNYDYDRNGNLKSTIDGERRVSTREYGQAGDLIATVDVNAIRTVYRYDAAGRMLTKTVDPDGERLITTYVYDTNGQAIRTTDARGVVTLTEYDRKGQVLSITLDPDGLKQTTRYSYDGRGKALSVTTPANVTTQYAYDKYGRRISEIIDPGKLNLETRYEYDANGNVVARTDAGKNLTRYLYDASNRLIYQIDATGAVNYSKYDENGKLVRTMAYARPISLAGLSTVVKEIDITARIVPDASDQVVDYAYDKDNRLIRSVGASGAAMFYAYDGNNNLVERRAVPLPTNDTASSGASAQVRMVYDRANRLKFTATAQRTEGAVTQWAVVEHRYDPGAKVESRIARATLLSSNTSSAMTQADVAAWIASVPADGQRDASTVQIFDGAGRLAFEIDPTGAVSEFDYDAQGFLIQRIDYAQRLAQPGRYSSAQAIAAVLNRNDPDNRIARTIRDAAGRDLYQVDALGSVTQKKFDAAGNVIQLIRYSRPISIAALGTQNDLAKTAALIASANAGAAPRIEHRVFDAAGRQIYRVDADGFVSMTDFDALGRVTKTTAYADAATLNLSAGQVVTQDRLVKLLASQDARKTRVNTFAYDAQGNLKQSTDPMGGTERYSYDALGRKLTFTNKLNAVWQYQYDAAGHVVLERNPPVIVTTAAPGTVATNEAISIEHRFEYDAFGNLITRIEAAGRPEQRITRYRYDAAGRQIATILPPVGVYQASADSLLTNGANGNAVRVEATRNLVSTVNYDAFGTAVSNTDAGGNRSYRIHDRAGRLIYEIDAARYVTGYTLDAFGNVKAMTRYAEPLDISGLTDNPGAEQIAARLAVLDHSRDRVIATTYDTVGHKLAVIEPLAESYLEYTDANGVRQSGYAMQRKVTVMRYNAFGEVTERETHGEDAGGNALNLGKGAHSYYYYNSRGQQIAEIDVTAASGAGDTHVEAGYLTTREYDAAGNLLRETEYASALNDSRNAVAWNEAGFTTPAPDVKDRITEFDYDAGNRKIVERRKNVEYSVAPDGKTLRGDAVTTFGYDALGNQVQIVDALGNARFNYYDALGRLTAEVGPSEQIRSRIAQLYVLLFNRGPDSGGLKYWMDRVLAGESMEDLARAMFQSGIAQGAFPSDISARTLVAQTYYMATSRPLVISDAEWNASWENKPIGETLLRLIRHITEYSGSDASRLDAQRNFNVKVGAGLHYAVEQNGSDPVAAAAATENALRLDNLRIRIAQLYIVLAGRAPDAESLNAWVAQLQANVPVSQVAESLYRSDALRALYPDGMDSARLLAHFYRNTLGTDPDAAGGAWQTRITREPIGTVIADFALYYAGQSSEAAINYRERVRAAVPVPAVASLTTAPVTVYRRDVHGNVVQQIEYARGAESANRAGFRLAGMDDRDRVTLTAYDLHGHAIQSFDAEGHLSFASYDSLGRVAKQWQTVTVDGQAKTAFQVMRYDELGRLREIQDQVATNVRGGSIAPASATSTGDTKPRLTAKLLSQPASTDVAVTWPAIGPHAGTLYVELSYVAPSGGAVTEKLQVPWPGSETGATVHLQGNDLVPGLAQSILGMRVLLGIDDTYVVLYENTEEELIKNALPPAPPPLQPVQFDRRLVSQGTEYNAFGDITLRVADGEIVESNTYDNAGRLVSSTAANGVHAVMQYDIEGRLTARVEGGLRTETRYDLLGHAIEQTLPRQYIQRGNGVSAVSAVYMDMAIVGRSAYLPAIIEKINGRQKTTETVMQWQGANTVELKWTSLAGWGDSEVWVELSYTAKPADGTTGPGSNETLNQTFSADKAKSGVSLSWSGKPAIDRINMVRVFKKSAYGEWVKVLERAQPGMAGQFFTIPAPDAADTAVRFQYRKAGQQSWMDYTQLERFGEVYMFNASPQADGKSAIFSEGNYEYQVIHDFHGKKTVHDSGVFAIGQVALRTQVVQLYVLLFNRAPVRSELDYRISQLESGKSLEYIAEDMMVSDAARSVYPAEIDHAGLIATVFRNALGREPDAGTIDQWTTQMESLRSRGRLITRLLQQVALFDGGTPAERTSHVLFMNKAAVAQAYAADMGGADVSAAANIIARVTPTDTLAALLAARNSAGVPSADHRTRVVQLFVLLFDRAPTHDELERWTREIISGKKSYETVAQALFEEGAARAGYASNLSATALFERIYKTALGRTDATMDSGAADWAKALEAEERNWQASTTQVLPPKPNLSKGIVFNRLIAALVGYSDTGNLTGQASNRLFQNKVRAALYYAAALQGNNADAGKAILQLAAPNDAVAALRAAEDATPSGLLRLQVARLYILLFNRAPDEQGLDYWTAELYKGESIARIASRMLNADPTLAARSDSDLVAGIYRAALGREASASESGYWTGRMVEGTRGDAIAAMLDNVVRYTGSDPVGLSSQRLFCIKAAVGLTYAELGGLDLAGAQTVIDGAAADLRMEAAMLSLAQASAIRDAAMAAEAQARAAAAATAAAATAAAVESTALAAAIASQQADAALKNLTQANLDLAQAKAKYEDATQLVKKTSDDLAAAELLANQTAAAAKSAAASAAADKSAEAAVAAQKAKATADAAALALAAARQNRDAAAKAATDAATLCGTTVANAASAQTALTNAKNALAIAQSNAAAAVSANTQAQAALSTANAAYAAASTAVSSLAQQAQQRTMVYQLYVLLFNRQNPDTEGVNYWVGKLIGGSTFAAVAQSMYVSGGLSSLTDASVVRAIYMGALGRTVIDTGGEAYWTSELANAGKAGYRSSKGEVFVNLITGVSTYAGSDPIGIASKQSFNTKVTNGLTAAAKQANDALIAAAEKARTASATASTTSSEVNRTASAAANAATAKTNADNFVSAVSNATSQDLAWRQADAASTTAAAAYAKAQSDANTASVSLIKANGDAAAVAAQAASNVAVQRTLAMQLYVLLFNGTRPDADSFTGWVLHLATGKSAAQLAQIMYESASARVTYPTGMLDADIIRTIYRNALGRVATDAEVKYWESNFLALGRFPAIVQLLKNVWDYNGTDTGGLMSARLLSEKVTTGLNTLADAEAGRAATARAAYQAAQNAEAQAKQAYVAASDKAKAYSDAASAGLNAKITVPATANQLQIAQMYAMLYNRAPEASGLAYWSGELGKGVAPEAVALSMIAADTTLTKKSATDFIATLYNNALGRAPDSDGLAYWTGELAKGKSKAAVALSIIANVTGYAGTDAVALKSRQLFNNKVAVGLSYGAVLGGEDVTQARAIFNLVTPTDATAAMAAAVAAVPAAYQRTQIAKLYVLLFDKAPDLDGLNYWVGQLGSGKSSAEVAQAMFNSAPARTLYPDGMSHEQIVTRLYANAFSRAPDADGLQYWKKRLDDDALEFSSLNSSTFVGPLKSDAQALPKGRVFAAFLSAIDQSSLVNPLTSASRQTFESKVADALRNVLSAAQAAINPAAQKTAAAADAVLRATTAAKFAMDVAIAARSQGMAAIAAIRTAEYMPAYMAGTMTASSIGLNGKLNTLPDAGIRRISQEVDRWGNVLSTTDARNSAWVTRYSYNAFNQQIESIQPGTDATDGPVINRSWYDRLGQEIATRDGNGNINGRRYDAAGNVTEELQADGGIVQHRLDGFGQRIATRAANGVVSTTDYDRLGNVVAISTGNVAVHDVTGEASTLAIARRPSAQSLVNRYSYDELGRRVLAVDASGAATRTVYDPRGNVIATIDPLNRRTLSGYDGQNRKIIETDNNGLAQRWIYDNGRLHYYFNRGGQQTSYAYNERGQVSYQTSVTGQSIYYKYDAAGYLAEIDDQGTGTRSTYVLDANGRRVRERTVKTGSNGEILVLQDNQLAYDALGRLTQVLDGRYRVEYGYDNNGNRTWMHTFYRTDATSTVREMISWNAYDAMNRQVIVDGLWDTETGKVDIKGSNGHRIAYDNAGNRIADTYYGKKIQVTATLVPIMELVRTTGPEGGTEYAERMVYKYDYAASDALVGEYYLYDGANRLTDVMRDGLHAEKRRYDAAGHMVQSGLGGLDGFLIQGQSNDKMKAAFNAAGVALDTRISRYDAAGQLIEQRIMHPIDGETHLRYAYDGVGNLSRYTAAKPNAPTALYEYKYDVAGLGAYQLAAIVGNQGGPEGRTNNRYDVNGHLVSVRDTTQPSNDRDMINDTAGHVLLKMSSSGMKTFSLLANDEILGSSSESAENFHTGFERVDAAAYMTGTTAYTVQKNEDLRSIARAMWGDANLWYYIAEANGIEKVEAGQVIMVPAKPNTIHNDRDTFRPYSVAQAVGDLTPNLPLPPPPKKRHSFFEKIFVAALAAIASYYTFGTASTFFAASLGELGAGIAAGAVAGAVSSAVGQVAGNLVGLQSGFSWSGVALGALSGAIGQAAGLNAFTGKDLGTFAMKAATGNAMNQGLAIALGMQERFNWSAVAAAAVAAPIAALVGDAMGGGSSNGKSPGFIDRFSREFVSGAVGEVVAGGIGGRRGGLAEVFGNALGNSVADGLGRGSQQYGELEQAQDLAREMSRGSWTGSQTGAQVPVFGQLGSGTFGIGGDVNYLLSPMTFIGQETSGSSADNRAALIAAEREMMPEHYTSVAGQGRVAANGDSISKILGTSNPQAVGNFMRTNGMSNSTIVAGRNYFIPGDVNAYGDNSMLGQRTLNTDNARLEQIATQNSAGTVGGPDMRPTIANAQALGIYSGSTATPIASRPEPYSLVPGSGAPIVAENRHPFYDTVERRVAQGVVDGLPMMTPLPVAGAITRMGRLFGIGEEAASVGNASATGLDWTRVSARTGGDAAGHIVQNHGVLSLTKPNQGVFYGNPISAVEDAWSIAGQNGLKPVTIGNRDFYVVARPNSGFAGGMGGQLENYNHVTIITESGTKRVVTAYPSGATPPLPKGYDFLLGNH